jgi:hypothetical protein
VLLRKGAEGCRKGRTRRRRTAPGLYVPGAQQVAGRDAQQSQNLADLALGERLAGVFTVAIGNGFLVQQGDRLAAGSSGAGADELDRLGGLAHGRLLSSARHLMTRASSFWCSVRRAPVRRGTLLGAVGCRPKGCHANSEAPLPSSRRAMRFEDFPGAARSSCRVQKLIPFCRRPFFERIAPQERPAPGESRSFPTQKTELSSCGSVSCSGRARLLSFSRSWGRYPSTKRGAGGKLPLGNTTVRSPARHRSEASRKAPRKA